MKKYTSLIFFLLIALLVLAFTQPHASTQAQSSAFPTFHFPVVPFSVSSSYVVTGKPTIGAQFINRVLAASGSPARGKGQALYTLGVKYGIDPVYALAFFLHESRFGTTGEATVRSRWAMSAVFKIGPASIRTGAAMLRCPVGRMALTTGISSYSTAMCRAR